MSKNKMRLLSADGAPTLVDLLQAFDGKISP
jgi:hypothetical protein